MPIVVFAKQDNLIIYYEFKTRYFCHKIRIVSLFTFET